MYLVYFKIYFKRVGSSYMKLSYKFKQCIFKQIRNSGNKVILNNNLELQQFSNKLLCPSWD